MIISTTKNISTYLILKNCRLPRFSLQQCSIKYYAPPKEYESMQLPENPKLPIVPKSPTYPPNQQAFKMTKQLHLIRGPEQIHNKLIHKQYGIVCVRGGRMKYNHFEGIRKRLLEDLDYTRVFAIWRVDPPWQPCTKRPIGITSGGGKGHIHHYVTPIKAHRIIIEVGGKCEFEEVEHILTGLANRLPFEAKAITQEMLEEEARLEKQIEEENTNRYTHKYLIQNNLLGIKRWTKKIDYKYFGKYM